MLRRSPKLHLCPVCGSESVFEWAAAALGDDFRSRVTLTCAECETTRVLVATTWAVDAYSRRHERQRFQIALALRDAERERIRALGARPPSIPGTAPSRGPSGGGGG